VLKHCKISNVSAEYCFCTKVAELTVYLPVLSYCYTKQLSSTGCKKNIEEVNEGEVSHTLNDLPKVKKGKF
jgi:hypothetical protein